MEDDTPYSCGFCESCRRKAAGRVAGYVLEKRFGQRRTYDRSDPAEKKYVHRQVRMLLAMTGLADEEIYSDQEMQLSSWGRAMRERQSSP